MQSTQKSSGVECVLHMVEGEGTHQSASSTSASSSLSSDSEESLLEAHSTTPPASSPPVGDETSSPLSALDDSAPDFSVIESTHVQDDSSQLLSSSLIADTTITPEYPTFKLVGDNIDKSVKPRFMRSDRQSRLLHYFHHFAVKDRLDLNTLSDIPRPLPTSDPQSLAKSILPSSLDNQTLKENFAIHISRILTSHMPFFKDSQHTITRHIPHIHSKEMSQKSTVVSYSFTENK